MDRNTAKQFLDSVKRIEPITEELTKLTYDMNPNDQKVMRTNLAEIMLDIYEKLKMPVLAEHPDLDAV